jgi:hypothetical protein
VGSKAAGYDRQHAMDARSARQTAQYSRPQHAGETLGEGYVIAQQERWQAGGSQWRCSAVWLYHVDRQRDLMLV